MAKVTKHGKHWRARWTDENGKRCSQSFQRKKDAELYQAQRELEVREIKDGIRLGRVPEKTFSDLCQWWLDGPAKRKRSYKDDESIIRCHLRPAFGHLRLRSITFENIECFKNSKSHLSLKTLSNVLTLLKTLLNRAFELGWLIRVPVIRKPKLQQRDFEFLKSEEEIRRFLVAAKEEGELVFMVYATAVYTGMRAGEILGLKWDDIDFQNRIIHVRRSYSGPPKSSKTRVVPILDILEPHLKKWKLLCPSKSIVFPNEAGNIHGPSARILQEVLHRVLDSAGFKAASRKVVEIRARRGILPKAK